MAETKKTTLLDLTGQYLELLELASDQDVDQQTVIDTMEALTGEIEVKADNYAAVMKKLDSKIKLYKTEYKRLKAVADHMENNYNWMKERIKGAMETMGKTKIEGTYAKLSIEGNGGVQPMKITGDVPQNYQRIIYEPDNEKIRAALEAGQELAFAHLEDRGTHLRIR